MTCLQKLAEKLSLYIITRFLYQLVSFLLAQISDFLTETLPKLSTNNVFSLHVNPELHNLSSMRPFQSIQKYNPKPVLIESKQVDKKIERLVIIQQNEIFKLKIEQIEIWSRIKV